MKKVLTIPNVLSFFRILLIPVFVYFYFEESLENHYVYSILVVILSGLTDMLDGIIARKFNMISSFGKFIDPCADKLTQGVCVVCLAFQNTWLFPLLVLFFVKELVILCGSILLYRSGTRPAEAKWWGKFSTASFYLMIFLVILNSLIDSGALFTVSVIVSIISSVLIVYSLIAYYVIYKKIRGGTYDVDEERTII